MHYILFVMFTIPHLFGPDGHTLHTQEFNNEAACVDVKQQLNLEFDTLEIKGHAECAPKG